MVLDRDPVSANSSNQQLDTTAGASQVSDLKKPFVEPAISVPADVLEATAFFQVPTLAGSDNDPTDGV